MQHDETPILFHPITSAPENFITGQVVLIDKPLWWTSFDVVRKCRNLITHRLKVKKLKVGHAGTLDPLATGLMIICTGKATKRINEWMDADKEYVATIELGRTTPSFDLETETDATFPTEHITRESFEASLQTFLGETQQAPPLFSAKNVQGKRAYTFARKGSDIELPAQPVVIDELEIIRFELPVVEVRIRCSKGTYVRAFARDLGLANQSGACLTRLRRTAIGASRVEKAMSPELFEQIISKI
ncbi:MAG: tRNA pseudouridine(55) synthase TruB [Bacteroidales bacterium]|jgi:tRNA pseudouridine55 synthase|nr:tRNA pseudouridine(55) synthase TruB [Bacteroidales bacterium]